LVCVVIGLMAMIGLTEAKIKHSHHEGQPPSSVSDFLKSTTVYDILSHIQPATPTTADSNSTMCWRNTYGRGVGVPIYACPSGQEKDGLLCYPLCKDGFYGVGPVCWAHCAAGFTDEGALCGKDGSIVPADNSQCPWYDVCGLVEAKGCSHCSDPTAHNDGCTCRIDPQVYAKDSYGRGAGYPLGCGNQQYDAGLCYNYCNTNFTGVGPVCWGVCPSTVNFEEGALCCDSAAGCDQKVDDLAKAVLTALAAAIEAGGDIAAVLAALKAAIDAALGFILPLCSDFP